MKTKYDGVKMAGDVFYHVSNPNKTFSTADECGREFNKEAFRDTKPLASKKAKEK